MKKISVMLIAVMLLAAVTPFHPAVANGTTEERPTFNQYIADYIIDYSGYDYIVNGSCEMPYATEVRLLTAEPEFVEAVALWKTFTMNLSDSVTNPFYESVIHDTLTQHFNNADLMSTLNKSMKATQISLRAKVFKALREYEGIPDEIPDNITSEEGKIIADAFQSCEELSDLYKGADIISTFFSAATTVEDAINKFAKACAIQKTCSDIGYVFYDMANHTSDSNQQQALRTMANICNNVLSDADILAMIAADASLSSLVSSCEGLMWGEFLTSLGPFGTGMALGSVIGKAAMNYCFSIDGLIEHFYEMMTITDYDSTLKATLRSYEDAYLNDKTDENAKRFISGYTFYLNMAMQGIDYTESFVDEYYTGGKVSSLQTIIGAVFGLDNYKNYQSMKQSMASMKTTLETMAQCCSYEVKYPLYLELYPEIVSDNAEYYTEPVSVTEEQSVELFEQMIPIMEKYGTIIYDTDTTIIRDVDTEADIYVRGGTLKLNGHTLKTSGNLYHYGGTIEVGSGTIEVGGNFYHVGEDSTFIEGDDNYYTYWDGGGCLKMQNSSGKLIIHNDMVLYAYGYMYYNNSEYLCSNGTIYIGGDLLSYGWYDCYGTGEHKIVFNGTKEQSIYFNNYYYNNLNNVRFENNRIRFASEGIPGFTLNDDIDLTFGTIALRINGTIDLNGHSIGHGTDGDLKLYGTLILTGSELIVNGDFYHYGGTIDISSGRLEVAGNFYHVGEDSTFIEGDDNYYTETGAGYLKMQNSNGKLIVKNSLILCGSQYMSAGCSNGVIEIGGDLLSYGYEDINCTSEHKFVINGENQQTISFKEDYDYVFGILQIDNPKIDITSFFKFPHNNPARWFGYEHWNKLILNFTIPRKTITLPDTLSAIGKGAFRNISANIICIPEGCSSIESGAFAGKGSLYEIHIPASVTSISYDAFEGNPLLTIVAPKGSYAESFANNYGYLYREE